MRTQTDIENQRRWVGFATVALLITYSFVAIAYGYNTLVDMAGGTNSFFAHAIASFVTSLCRLPGIVLWRHLRSSNKFAALYGLLTSATLCCLSPLVGNGLTTGKYFGL